MLNGDNKVSMSVFVIVVTYKGFLWYQRCFDSLRASELPVKTIVVDNSSNDGTIEYIKEKYPEIHLIESKENLGFGRANNLGIRYALDNGCDYVFLLNQDAWIEPETIKMLVSIHAKHAEYGILSPIHLNVDKTAIENGLMHYIQDYRIMDSNMIDDLYFGRLDDVYSTCYVNAAAWLLPHKTLEMIGGFDPIFYHYGEDDNYMSRVLYHNLLIGLCPKAKIVHNTEIVGIRRSSKEEQERRRQLLLLKRFTDINKEESINRYVVYLIRKSFVNIFSFRFSVACQNIRDIVFLVEKTKSINISRAENKKIGRNWI